MLNGAALLEPASFGDGTLRLGPPPQAAMTAARSALTGTDAVSAFQALNLYTAEIRAIPPTPFLATVEQPNMPSGVDDPIPLGAVEWIVFYPDIPVAPSGAGGQMGDGSSSGASPEAIPEDILAIVDPQTGVVRKVITTTADPSPLDSRSPGSS